MTTARYSTAQELTEQLVLPALGEFANEYDVEALTADLSVWEDGKIVVTVEGDEFWEIAEHHDRKLAPLRAAADAHARLVAAEAEVDRIRAERDDAIRAAVAGPSTQYAVGRFVGITQQAVARICARG